MGRKNEATRNQLVLKKPRNDPSYKRIFGNYPAKKYKKGTPAVTRLSFEFTGPGTRYVDIALALSIINRRMYRQGCYYYVNSVEFYDNANSMVDLHTIPDTWITKAAHRRAKGVFDEMNERAARSGAMSVYPKYHDFKVFMSKRHLDEGTTLPVLYDINGNYDQKVADDWVLSTLVSADDDGDGSQEADDFLLHMLGDHNGNADNWVSVGLIKSYMNTRPMPDDNEPNFPSGADLRTDPLVNLVDYSSEEQMNDIIDNLNADNDTTPYDANAYIGAGGTGIRVSDGTPTDVVDMHHVVRLNTTAETGRVATGAGFCAPLGLICVDPDNAMASDNKFRVVLNLAIGTYHGVYAETI